MNNVVALGVVGTDGQVPIYNPNGRWSWWSIDEIYMGTTGSNKYVPNVKDYIIDPTTFTVYIVTLIDPVTLVPSLNEIIPAAFNTGLSNTDILFGVGPGTQSDTYRVYLDTSLTPYTLAVDVRLRVAGTRTSYCIIYKGPLVADPANMISMIYDSNGNFISNKIPLELVAIDNTTNYSIKAVSVCNTSQPLVDGEIVTAVFYDAQANVVSKRQLLVENTSFIRSLNVSLKYITGIALDSPFLSLSSSSTIEFPLNVPVNALNLQGIVSYSDGSSITLPIDGVKFSVIGLDQYVSTIVGQKIPLVLTYALGPNEVTYSAALGNGNYITEPYYIVTTNSDNSYDVKIYGYPEWGGVGVGYTMRFFLVNLDRNIFIDVTEYTTFASDTGLYDPTQYGYVQRKAVQLNLNTASGIFKPYIFTQLMDINLITTPSGTITPWTVSQVSGSDIPPYGTGLVATISSIVGLSLVNISGGITDFPTWLTKVYNQTFPLVNPYNETAAIAPTHFALIQGTNEVVYPITSWNQNLSGGLVFAEFSNVYIKFINRTVSGDQILSIAGMLVSQIN